MKIEDTNYWYRKTIHPRNLTKHESLLFGIVCLMSQRAIALRHTLGLNHVVNKNNTNV